MKITKKRLKQLIQEELAKTLKSGNPAQRWSQNARVPRVTQLSLGNTVSSRVTLQH